MATPITAAGDARSDTQQPDRINLQASLSQSSDITTDSEPFSSSPKTEQQHLVSPKITFKYDAALLYASEDEDLAEDLMKEMNKLTLKNGRNVKVICYDHPEFEGSVIARPRQVLKKCRFVFSLVTKTCYDKVADYTNEEAVAYSKLHTERPFRQIFPMYTEKYPDMEVPVGLACEDPLIWYGSEVKRKKKLLTFMNYHICENTTDVINESKYSSFVANPQPCSYPFSTEVQYFPYINTCFRSFIDRAVILQRQHFVSIKSYLSRYSSNETGNTSNRPIPPPVAANDDSGSIQGIQEEGLNRGSEQMILVGCTNVNIVYERNRKVQMGTPTSPENNPDDRYDIIEDGPEETSSLQEQISGQEDGTQTHFRSNSASSSSSDEWHDAVTHHPVCDATLTHPKSIASEEGRANSHLELPALGLAELDINKDQGSGREEGRGCEEFSGFRQNLCLKYLLRKSIVNTSEIQFHEKIVELAKSVGCVRSSTTTGTAFRVGQDSIMTCWHVIHEIIEKCIFLGEKREEDILDNVNVWVQFRYIPGEEHHPDNKHRFLFSEIQYRSPELDFAIIKLKVTEGKYLPPAIKRFTGKGGHEILHLIGHDRGKAKELDPGCKIAHPTREEIQECDQRLRQKLRGRNIGTVSEFYEGMAARGRIHFHCAFEKGASGSPGVVFDRGELHVVTMLCRGYPNFYYNFQEEQRNQFGIEDGYFIEEGIDMNEVYNHLKESQHDIFSDIFGDS